MHTLFLWPTYLKFSGSDLSLVEHRKRVLAGSTNCVAALPSNNHYHQVMTSCNHLVTRLQHKDVRKAEKHMSIPMLVAAHVLRRASMYQICYSNVSFHTCSWSKMNLCFNVLKAHSSLSLLLCFWSKTEKAVAGRPLRSSKPDPLPAGRSHCQCHLRSVVEALMFVNVLHRKINKFAFIVVHESRVEYMKCRKACCMQIKEDMLYANKSYFSISQSWKLHMHFLQLGFV